MRTSLYFSILTFYMIGCSVEKDNRERIVILEKLMRSEQLNENKIQNTLSELKKSLENQKDKNLDLSYSQSNISFKWNSDSSIILIQSLKRHINGFKRETILNINDTLLVIERFEALTENQNTKGYELVESFSYMDTKNNIINKARRIFPATLEDTVRFRKISLAEYHDGTNNHFNNEFEYSKNIFRRN